MAINRETSGKGERTGRKKDPFRPFPVYAGVYLPKFVCDTASEFLRECDRYDDTPNTVLVIAWRSSMIARAVAH